MALDAAAYPVGAIVVTRHRPDPVPAVFGFHEVWHACTVVAGVSHFAMVWLIATGEPPVIRRPARPTAPAF